MPGGILKSIKFRDKLNSKSKNPYQIKHQISSLKVI